VVYERVIESFKLSSNSTPIVYVLQISDKRTVFFRLGRSRYSFICQSTSTRRQWSDLFGHRVELPPVTICLITQR